MNLHKKLAVAALMLAIAGGAYAAASSPNRNNHLPQFERSDDESQFLSPPRSTSPFGDFNNTLTRFSNPGDESIFSSTCSSSSQQPSTNYASSSYNTNSDNPGSSIGHYFDHFNKNLQPEKNSQQIETPIQAPTYTFHFRHGLNGYGVTLMKAAAIGGAAGLGTYALYKQDQNYISPARLKRIAFGIGSGAALASGLYMSSSANGELNSIEETRHNLSHDRHAFARQIAQFLQPTLDRRVAPIERRIQSALNNHKTRLRFLNSQITSINNNYNATKSLPAEIAKLKESVNGQNKKCADLLARYNELCQEKVNFTDQEMNAASRKFDAQVTKALDDHKNQCLNPGQRPKPLSDFLPKKIKNTCWMTTAFAEFNAGIGAIALNSVRGDVIIEYAKKSAKKRHDSQVLNARRVYTQATNLLDRMQGQINEAEARLRSLVENSYDDRTACDEKIATITGQIEQANDTYNETNKNLQAQRTVANTPLDEDLQNATAELTQNCSSANKSWYQGVFLGGVTSAVAAAAGLWYYLQR